jgi:hypothetical protein
MPRSNKPVAATRRYATDDRCESQLVWLQQVGVLAFGGKRPPSASQIIRRAVGLLTEHTTMTIEAGRHDGLTGPRPQDAAAERAALEDHGRIIEAPPPTKLIDQQGRLLPWQEAILRNGFRASALNLAIPAKD